MVPALHLEVGGPQRRGDARAQLAELILGGVPALPRHVDALAAADRGERAPLLAYVGKLSSRLR